MIRSLILPALAAAALAQEPKPNFEVASIRVAVRDESHRFSVDRSRLLTHNVTLRELVAHAFDLAPEQVFGGPDWAGQESYDIRAKIPEDLSQKQQREQFPAMLRNLLFERFHLTSHQETRQVSGYTLVVSKGGSKLEAAKSDQTDTGMHSSRSELTATNANMETIVKFLAGRLEAPVVDKTDLKGGFNFKLRWSSDALAAKPEAAADAPPSLSTAVQEQLGLKLDSGKVLVPAILIDSAQRPNAN